MLSMTVLIDQHDPATQQPTADPASSGGVELTITFRKDVHHLHDLTGDTTLATLRSVIEQLTNVAARNQKLLPARAKGVANLNQAPAAVPIDEDPRTLLELGIPNQGCRLMVVGTPSKELEEAQAEEDYNRRRNGPRQYHPSMLRGTRPRSTATPGATFSPFGNIQPHPSTLPESPLHDKITQFLSRLANDPAILHICKLHHFTVGTLTELLPWEHPELLGLNENAGQKIYLRLRTDDAEGLRNYKTTRRVLLHELAHNKVADHPPEFKILNSELNAQVEAFEKRQAQGTHRFIEGNVYDAEAARALLGGGSGPTPGSAVAGGQRLGGGGSANAANPVNAEERRRQILQATMKRLEKEEQEIERGCGSGA
ncbi:hypothetical protein ACQY0O_003315 [Thecaphora frezii]